MAALEYHRIDITDPRSRALLEKAYHALYVPAFPVADERDDLDLWLACYRTGKELVVIVAGSNLSDTGRCDLKAMSVAYYLPEANAGLLCYNVIDPSCRRQGAGRKMVELRIEALREISLSRGYECLEGAYLEIEDPRRTDKTTSTVDPAERLRFYTRMGAEIVPLRYVQPETRPGGGRCHNLLLLACPLDGLYPEPPQVRRFLEALYRDAHDAAEPAADHDFQAMSRQIDEWEALEASRAGRGQAGGREKQAV